MSLECRLTNSLADLDPARLNWSSPESGLDYAIRAVGHSIGDQDEIFTDDSRARFYWANGPSPSQILQDVPVIAEVPINRVEQKTYSPHGVAGHLAPDAFSTPPLDPSTGLERATHVIMVVDPLNEVHEVNEENNASAVAVTDIALLSAQQSGDGITFRYQAVGDIVNLEGTHKARFALYQSEDDKFDSTDSPVAEQWLTIESNSTGTGQFTLNATPVGSHLLIVADPWDQTFPRGEINEIDDTANNVIQVPAVPQPTDNATIAGIAQWRDRDNQKHPVPFAHVEIIKSITAGDPSFLAEGPDLQLMSWGDGSGMPTSGKNLVIAGIDNDGLLHIRTFDAAGVRTDIFETRDSGGALDLKSTDASGAVLSDEPESSLPTAESSAITTLKQQLPDLLPPHALSSAERDEVLIEVSSSIDHTLAETTTDIEGNYAAGFDFNAADKPNVFVRVFARSDAANISPDGGDIAYYMDSGIIKGVTGGLTNLDTVARNNTEARYTAFSVLSAMTLASTYASDLIIPLATMPAQVDVRFSLVETDTFYTKGTRIIHVMEQDRWDWDVVAHEYGHYVANSVGFGTEPAGSDKHPPGANLSIKYGKLQGTELAFGEGWADFFAIEASLNLGGTPYAKGVPGVGNSIYEDTEDRSESTDAATTIGKGEDNEDSVMDSLYHLAQGDRGILVDAKTMFIEFISSGVQTMGDAWNAIASPSPNADRERVARILGDQKIAPVETAPNENAELKTSDPPTFKWDKNGGGPSYNLNDFKVAFYTSDMKTKVFESKDLGDTNNYTPDPRDWATILNGHSSVKWVVEGKNTASPETPDGALGWYWSAARTITGITTPAFDSLVSPTIVYGTASIHLSGHLASGTRIPTGVVAIHLGGVSVSAPIEPSTGNFSATFPTAALVASSSPYAIAYTYPASADFNQASGTSNLTINKADPMIIWANPADIIYGTPLGAAQLDASASVPGVFIYTPASGTPLAPGRMQILSAMFTPADTANFNSVTATIPITVTATPRVQGRVALVRVLYGELLGRNPEPRGLQYWVKQLGGGATPSQVTLAIHGSREHRGLSRAHRSTGISAAKALRAALRAERLAVRNAAQHARSARNEARFSMESVRI
jgi:hypothetical protein